MTETIERAVSAPTIALDLIAPSPTNPRRREQNQASNLKAWKLDELAESIRLHDVKVPVSIRPNPNYREGNGRPPYELIAGERRWRASKIAGKTTIPYTLEELSDFDVLLLQVVENIQREDLHPLEEADHYAKLLRTPNGLQGFASAEELAKALGKSERFVYNRLALLKLGTEAREACFDGKISASVALELAEGVPAGPDQVKALKELIQGWAGEPYSARQASAHLKKTYMLRLDRARFDTTARYPLDNTFAAGPCGDCPKRTGANPDFFSDVKEGDLCQDAACFNAKTAAAHKQLLDTARDEGATVISGEKAAKLMRAGATKPFGHQLLDQPCIAFSDHPKPLRAAVGDAIKTTDLIFVDVPGAEAPVIVVSDEVAQRALKAKGLLKITAAMPPKAKPKAKAKDGGGALLEPAASKLAAKPEVDAADDQALLDEMLSFKVLPSYKPPNGHSAATIKSSTENGTAQAFCIMVAHAVGRRVQRGESYGLPETGFARLVLILLLYGDAALDLRQAARLAGVDASGLPAQNGGGILKQEPWCWALPEEQACRLVLVLMALQGFDNPPNSPLRQFPAEIAAQLDVDASTFSARATQLVRERLQLELVKLGKPAAKKKPVAKSAPAKKAAASKTPRPAAKAALSPEAVWPFPNRED